ncbi:efflux RND transporter permease subunit [Escherichia coli]
MPPLAWPWGQRAKRGANVYPPERLERTRQKTGTSFAIIERATKAFNKIKEARVIASSPPAISGLGSSAGFDMELQDHAGAGHDALMAARNQLLALAAENPELTRVRHNGLDDSPQLQIDIDQRKAQALGVAIDDM